jgi:hypothetical protein
LLSHFPFCHDISYLPCLQSAPSTESPPHALIAWTRGSHPRGVPAGGAHSPRVHGGSSGKGKTLLAGGTRTSPRLHVHGGHNGRSLGGDIISWES